MRIKAKGSGLVNVEDYRRDRALDDIDLLDEDQEELEEVEIETEEAEVAIGDT